MLLIFSSFFLQDSSYDRHEALHRHTAVTVAQAALLIMAFAVRHSLSHSAIGDLLQLLSLLLPTPSSIPASYHLFQKLFKPPTASVKTHFYCSNKDCMSAVGEVDIECKICKTEFSAEANKKSGSFFLTIGLETQIKSVLEADGVADQLFSNKAPGDSNVSDICDGTFYRSLTDLTTGSGNISLTWNCDGIPLFKSSTNSIWPIRCTINELPPSVSVHNMLVAGLWFGSCKPCMSSYLLQFVNNVSAINKAGGVKWIHPITKEQLSSKVYASFCSADAAARCSIQGIQQYNGQYGCSWCLCKGEVVEKGRGFTRAYSVVNELPRTHESIIQHGNANVASGDKHTFGVKTVSPLMLLQNFNMVESFIVDYMHCVLLGCVRQFMDLWLNSKYHEKSWYVGTDTNVIDANLVKICPPCDIKRTPRSVRKAQTWKASECFNWLFFYSLYVLNGILRGQFLRHWLLLVEGVYSLLETNISRGMIESAHEKLEKFVVITGKLYGKEHMVYNIHQLLHLSDCVKRCGPLWRTSAFAFEGHNIKLLKLFSGTNYIPTQIANSLVTLTYLPGLLKDSLCEDETSVRVQHAVSQWLSGYPLTFSAQRVRDVVVLGAAESRPLSVVEQTVLLPLCAELPANVECYSRILIRGKVFCTHHYGERLKTNSYTVELNSSVFGSVVNFVFVRNLNTVFVILKMFEKLTLTTECSVAASASHMHVVRLTDTVVAVKSDDIRQKCVFLGKVRRRHPHQFLIASQPNVIEMH